MSKSWTFREWLLPWLQLALVAGLAADSGAVLPLLACLAALVAVPFRKGPIEHRRWLGWAVLVACGVWWIGASMGRSGGGFAELLRIGGWCLILLGSLQILSLGRGGSTVLVAWCSIGAVLVFSSALGRFGPVAVGLDVLLVVEALRRREGLVAGLGTALVRWCMVLVAAVGVAVALQARFAGHWWLSGARWTESVRRVKGFSTISKLGTFGAGYTSWSDREVVLRVWSDSAPGLLKGMVHDLYSHGNWIAERRPDPRSYERMTLDFSQFCRDQVDNSRPRAWAQSPDERVPVLFAPSGTGCVGVVADSLVVAASGVFYAPPEGLGRGWTWYDQDEVDTLVAETDLRVPRELVGMLDSFLVVAGCDSAARVRQKMVSSEIVNNLSGAMESGFRYSLDPVVEDGVDPLRSFFRMRRGYCEHYATAAVLLLRRAGVPARYATGLSGPERSGGGTWIYRQGGAHAWAEWKPKDGNWRVLDLVAAQAPPPGFRTGYRAWTESVRSWGVVLWHRLRDGAWRERLDAWQTDLASSFGWRWGLSGSLLVAALVATVLWRRRRQALGAVDLVWSRRLGKAESLLRRQGFVRSSSETVGAFLERLPAVADERSRQELRRYQAYRWRRSGN